jgi:hypothetical protein
VDVISGPGRPRVSAANITVKDSAGSGVVSDAATTANTSEERTEGQH